MINSKCLFQALKFACLPTLSVLVLLFFGFFSISETLNFISSDNPWAVFLRILLVIAEFVLVCMVYSRYLIKYQREQRTKKFKEELEQTKSGSLNTSFRKISYNSYIRDAFVDGNSSDDYILHYTKNNNIVLIERKLY